MRDKDVEIARLREALEKSLHAFQQLIGGHEGPLIKEIKEALSQVAPTEFNMEILKHQHRLWSEETFGDVGPLGPLKHLAKEALEAIENPSDPSEYIDCQFLIWDAMSRSEFTPDQFLKAGYDKLAENKKRDWSEIKEGEAIEHIREPAPAFPDWQPIATAPKASDENLKVWVFGGSQKTPRLLSCDGGFWRAERAYKDTTPTHWCYQVIPDPPKGAE